MRHNAFVARHSVALAALGTALAVVAAACSTSSIRSTDVVTIHGTVQDDSGRGVAGRSVLARKSLSTDELRGRMQRVLSSVELACVDSRPPSRCHRAHYLHVAKSGNDGSFRVVLKGQDTQTALGLSASTIEIAVNGDAPAGTLSGPSTSQAVDVQVTDLPLPPLRLWSALPSVDPTSPGAHVGWSPLPADAGASPLYRVLFDDGGGGLVWDSGPLQGRTSYDVDGRVLEDADGAVSVVATADTQVTKSADRLAFRTSRRHVRSAAGVPASRGKPCSVALAGAAPTAASPCGLTDGAFDRFALANILGPALGGPNAAGTAAAATVDLGEALSPTLIVVRGCPTTCAVDASSDGTTFAPAGTATRPDALLAATGNAPARYVRVSGRVPDLAALTELSVWTPTQARRPSPSNAVTLAPGTPHGQGGGDSGLETAAKLAAVVLLISVAAAGGFLLGRRRLAR